MKTSFKDIRFVRKSALYAGKPAWVIHNKLGGNDVGNVFWYPPLQKYTAKFRSGIAWERSWLLCLMRFLEGLNS